MEPMLMPSFISKPFLSFQKLAILSICALAVASCDSGGGKSNISGVSEDIVFTSTSGTVSAIQGVTNSSGDSDIQAVIDNGGVQDTATRQVLIQLQTTAAGVIGSLSATEAGVTERVIEVVNGNISFTVYRASLQGDGVLILTVLDNEVSLAISDPIPYTINGVIATTTTAAGAVTISLQMVEKSDFRN